MHAVEKIKIFTLHSYSQEYPWTKSQHKAFVETLSSNKNQYEFYTEYLDTKRISFTQEYQNEFISHLNKKYAKENVDLIYVTDDNALKFIHQNYHLLFTKSTKPPVFFSGVNNLNMHTLLPQETFRGVYEVKEIKENIELIKQFSPQTRDIYFIGDDSQTYKSIKKVISQKESSFQNLRFHYIDDEYLSIILKELPKKPRSFVLLTTIGKLKDTNSNTLLPQESIKKIKENKNLILLTMEDAYMYKGVVGGYVTNGSLQAKEAANLVLKYLKNRSLQELSSLLKSPNSYTFNSKELVSSRIILSEYISREAIFIKYEKNFIEKNQSQLLSALVILTMGLILSLIVMYTYFTKKNNNKMQLSLQNEYEDIKQKLNLKDEFINNIMRFGNIAYWRLDIKKDELFLSQNLLQILSIDDGIYKDDSSALSYFVHERDKALFQEQLHLVKENKNSVTFQHKMVSTEKEVFNVNHIIYTQYLAHQYSSVIYGIIEFEK